MFSSLPNPTGPYVLGVADLEIDQLLVRLFYPARLTPPPGPKEPKPSWMITLAYARGYGDFLKAPSFIFVPLFGALFSGLRIPNAVQDAPLVKKEKEGENSRLPLVVFSHGLGGMRTTYSAICADMASHGFVVACVEHRDQSASMTFRNDHQEELRYKRLPEDVDEFEFRNGQVKHRVDEMVKTYELLQRLDRGESLANIIRESKFPLTELKDRLDFTKVAVMGHSFGGATAVQTGYYHPDLFHCVLSLDGWMFPVNKEIFLEHEQPGEARPMFFLNTDLFQWRANLACMKALVAKTNQKLEAQGRAPTSTVMKILGSGHQNQSDFALLVPQYALQKSGMSGPIDPLLCQVINDRACRKFLQQSLDWKNEKTEKDTVLERGSQERPRELVFDDEDSGKPFEKKPEDSETK